MACGVILVACLFRVASAEEEVDYRRDVKPLLGERCFACHGALKQEAGLRLDTGALIREGGDSGAAAVPFEPEASLVLDRVTSEDPSTRMPPEGQPLTAEQIETLRGWIRAGAISPDTEQAEPDPRDHWAFRPPLRPTPPVNETAAHPIDAFLDAELADRKLTPRPPASREVLLRRVHLDLIGLPPTRNELRDFLADTAPDAYERVVDRLLDDPRHGERWARHWMDVWRYSDWYGRRDVGDVRNSASQLFRWRDWIVRSLNAGKGYDQMVREMLAADEILPEDYEAGVATGYLIRNYYSLNPNDWMRNAVEHTGKAFLGLTFNCAHCHDHKYDPISQIEYFQMRAFFEPIFVRQDRVPSESDPGVFQDYEYSGTRDVQRLGAVRTYDRQLDAPTWFYAGGDERNRDTERGPIPAEVPAFLKSPSFKIESISLPARAWYPGLRAEIQETMRDDALRLIRAAEETLASAPSVAESPKTEELTQAESAFAQTLEQWKQSGRRATLAGEQSLLLEAKGGRAMAMNSMRDLTVLEDGLALEFHLEILRDGHANFQLVKDSATGLTAGYFGWEQGRILAYCPGQETEVEVGKYDFAAGQSRFHVLLELRPSADEGRLTIRSLSDELVLVDQAPTKMNGWNPIGSDLQSICFDAQKDGSVVIDDIFLASPPKEENASAARRLLFDFEAPKYADGVAPSGIDGWFSSTFSRPPGIAVVSRAACSKELRDAADDLARAQRRANGPRVRRRAAEARLAAAHANLEGLEARIAAERARHGETDGANVTELTRAASLAEREANVRRAESDLLEKEVALLDAEAMPADDANLAKAIEAMTQARAELEKNRAARSDDSLAETFTPLSPQYPRQSTGRRRALAEWIVHRDNPLTARVAVNHVWTRHVQSPLVASMYDFGRNGEKPTHPELLDWLAVEFIESGWSLKHLHRRIVTSAAYRRVSSVGDAADNVARDPENRFLWRMNSARMESEVVRDSLLYVSGRLDPTVGGVEIDNKEALTTARRSLYYACYPEEGGKSPLGELFDAPDPLDCYRRVSSIVPQQALALTNSELVRRTSAAIVHAWHEGKPTPNADADAATDFIVAMFETILSRAPSDAERQACLEILERQRQLAVNPDAPEAIQSARESLARVLLNHNDFLTVR